MAGFPELNGKVALITGAGRPGGIGEAIAGRLAAEGCRVIVTDIGRPRGAEIPANVIGAKEDLARVAAGIRAQGGECKSLALDVLDEIQVQAAMLATVKHYGGLDILVNNAGIGHLLKPLTELTVAEWDATLGVNLRGAFITSKHAALQMIAQRRGGRIVNIASQSAKSASPFAAADSASKHGLIGLTRVAALELAAHSITVNAVCPNHVGTALGAVQTEYYARVYGMSVADYENLLRSRIPLGRAGLPADTANACAWLCSDQAHYVTGEALNVSGGEEMH